MIQMFNTFNQLHDDRKSTSIPYFSFYDKEENLIKGSIEVSFDDNGQFDILTVDYNGETIIYTRDMYTYTTECLYVLGIGFLLPGDIVKLKIDDIKRYELNFGWHENISGQKIYSWYLKEIPQELYYDTKNGIFQSVDLAEMNINSKGVLTFYEEFLDTIEVVEYKKDRLWFETK